MDRYFLLLVVPFLLLVSSCGSGEGSFNLEVPGINGPKVELTKNHLEISMIFENISVQKGLRYDIPHYSNSRIEVTPDLHSSGSVVTLKMARKDLITNPLAKLKAQYLPGGQAGKLPGMAFSIEQLENIFIFQSKNEFAIWIPLKTVNLPDSILSSSYYSNNVKVGELSLVGANKNGENAGMLLKLQIQL